MSAYAELIGETDAQKWAHEFAKVAELRPDIPRDEGTMIGWFANAIMAGYDQGARNERNRGIVSIIREIAFESAGAGSGAVMKRAPDVIMPDEEIMKSVTKILSEFGISSDWRDNDRRDTGRDCVDGSDDAYGPSEKAQASSNWRREENARRKAVGLETESDGPMRKHRPMVAE